MLAFFEACEESVDFAILLGSKGQVTSRMMDKNEINRLLRVTIDTTPGIVDLFPKEGNIWLVIRQRRNFVAG